MERPFEVVAVAVGQILWSLSGAVDSRIVERMAVLQHDLTISLLIHLLGFFYFILLSESLKYHAQPWPDLRRHMSPLSQIAFTNHFILHFSKEIY